MVSLDDLIVSFFRLIEIQCRLFDLGACVATPPNSDEEKLSYTKVTKSSSHCDSHSHSYFSLSSFHQITPFSWRIGLICLMLSSLH